MEAFFFKPSLRHRCGRLSVISTVSTRQAVHVLFGYKMPNVDYFDTSNVFIICYNLQLYSGIHALLPMKHHPGPDPGPGLDLDRDPGQGQEAGLYRDQDQEVVAGSVFALP